MPKLLGKDKCPDLDNSGLQIDLFSYLFIKATSRKAPKKNGEKLMRHQKNHQKICLEEGILELELGVGSWELGVWSLGLEFTTSRAVFLWRNKR